MRMGHKTAEAIAAGHRSTEERGQKEEKATAWRAGRRGELAGGTRVWWRAGTRAFSKFPDRDVSEGHGQEHRRRPES